ncbi:hypothetical protein RZE82_04605 [Mollicutes bacterium LVI A0039]|nr:hypothetical protein RZE82_04605 [Mollicutes bacterium LVI A0039]
MQVMIAKPQMLEFLNTTISKYETRPSGKYVIQEFAHPKFNIKVYNTGTMTVSGSKEFDIFTKLLKYTNEEYSSGSDEVGVGDFFGPTVYCCVKLTPESLAYIAANNLVIKDSKKMTDDEIFELFEKHLKDNIEYHVAVAFDRDIPRELNSIEQKSYYHNQLTSKFTDLRYAVIDLYTTENNFHKVTTKLNLTWPKPLVLETKADSKYYSVALASIIARYHFVVEMDKLDLKYNYHFPYGANVAKEAQVVADLLGKEEMAKFCKTTFKTFDALH